eukprot:1021594-Pleurochrysis_carterae.AAC.4
MAMMMRSLIEHCIDDDDGDCDMALERARNVSGAVDADTLTSLMARASGGRSGAPAAAAAATSRGAAGPTEKKQAKQSSTDRSQGRRESGTQSIAPVHIGCILLGAALAFCANLVLRDSLTSEFGKGTQSEFWGSEKPFSVDSSGGPWAFSTHPDMATEGFNWTQPSARPVSAFAHGAVCCPQLSMSRAGNFPPTGAKYYTAEQVGFLSCSQTQTRQRTHHSDCKMRS